MNHTVTAVRPPAAGRRLSGWCDLPGSPLAPSIARRWVAAMLDSWDPPRSRADRETIVELTSELVTNAVQHAEPDPYGDQNIKVNVRMDYDRVWRAVCDRDPTLPVQRAPDFVAESGRGLFLVDAQADQWGFVRYDGGKYVWFGLECRDDAPQATHARPDLTVATSSLPPSPTSPKEHPVCPPSPSRTTSTAPGRTV